MPPSSLVLRMSGKSKMLVLGHTESYKVVGHAVHRVKNIFAIHKTTAGRLD
jgi:hypothetical protein